MASDLLQLADNAGEPRPQGCTDMFPRHRGGPPPAQVTFYVAPGGPIIEGVTSSHRFIAFIYNNMDVPRIAWPKLTGEQQWEWYTAWERNGRGWTRSRNETLGLRGTNCQEITTSAELRRAMIVSPSLAERRPDVHPLPNNTWTRTRRQLF
jgi:hypothetical protein